MIEIPFDPAFALGPVGLTWHAVFGLLGVLAGAALGIRLVRERVGFDDAYAVAIAGVVGGLAGSRLLFVLQDLPRYLADPARILAVGDGGATIVGGVIGGLGGGMAMVRARGLPFTWIADRGSIGLPLGMAIGRIGDLINGEHWAAACAGLPWCVRYTHPASYGQREWVHPAVAYELLLDLAIVGVLLLRLRAARGRWAGSGLTVPLFLALYGAGRLALATVRLDPPWLGGVTEAELVSGIFLALGLAGLVRGGAAGRNA